MKHVVFILLLLVAIVNVLAQDVAVDKGLTRKERREIAKNEKVKADSLVSVVVGEMIKNQQFVLEANMLRGKGGVTYVVSSNLNFIAIDSNEVLFQFGSSNLVGINGLGGVTIEGRVSDYKYKYNEKSKMYKISMLVKSTGGIYTIILSVGNTNASARITTLRGGVLDYSGKIVAIKKSVIYKGTHY